MKKSKILPRGKYVLIKPNAADPKENEHGLLIPSNVEQEQRAIGKVEAVSPEIKDIKIGDEVVYGVFAGETVKLREADKEVEYKLVHDDDVIAFLK